MRQKTQRNSGCSVEPPVALPTGTARLVALSGTRKSSAALKVFGPTSTATGSVKAEVPLGWIGPRCGIPYWLEVRRGRGGLRIYRPGLLQSEDDFVQFRHREYLDAYTRSYERLAQAVWVAKGGLGGRFYVTEAGTVWTPYRSGPAPMDWNYRYVGCLWDHVNEWYPKWWG